MQVVPYFGGGFENGNDFTFVVSVVVTLPSYKI